MNTRVEKKYKIDPWVKISTRVPSGSVPFRQLFEGFDRVEVVRKIFGTKTDETLSKLNVEVFPREGFMGVSDEDGHIFASQVYLKTGDTWCIYLDTVHELVHVRQFFEGKELFDPSYSYVDRPTEVEAYTVGTLEARRIGLSESEIFDYLKVPWISRADHIRLAKNCGVFLNEVPQVKENQQATERTKRA